MVIEETIAVNPEQGHKNKQNREIYKGGLWWHAQVAKESGAAKKMLAEGGLCGANAELRFFES